MNQIEVTLEDGKYTVILNKAASEPGRTFYALRYGEHWRDLTGDKLMLAMFNQIVELDELRFANANKGAKIGAIRPNSDLFTSLEKIFAEQLQQKTGWGRNEILAAFRSSMIQAALTHIDNG